MATMMGKGVTVTKMWPWGPDYSPGKFISHRKIINRTNLLWMLLERQVQCLNQDKIKANCWCYSQAASRESNLKVGGHQRNDPREDRCVPPGPTHLVPPGTRFLILTCSGILKTSRIGDTLSSCFFLLPDLSYWYLFLPFHLTNLTSGQMWFNFLLQNVFFYLSSKFLHLLVTGCRLSKNCG